ncbi:MAG: UDP-N-acetylmuramyl-tripeptide synthetase [Bacillota bacterium]
MDQQELLKPLTIINIRPDKIKPVTSLVYHSNEARPGSLFVCIRGHKTDGHQYLKQAVENGAVAAVVENFVDEVKIPQYQVADTRTALAVLADRFYDHPSEKINVTGVTASNGKTTTTYMLNAILEEYGLTTGLVGTVIVKMGDEIIQAGLTTPESLDLHYFFHQMVEHKVTHAVMEVSSSGLELKRVGNVDFDIVVLNNISREHIDLHGSFEAYFKAKASLVREAKENSWAVLNLDCPYTTPLASETRARTFTYSLKNSDAHCLVRDLDLSSGRARFKVELAGNNLPETTAGYPRSFPVKLSVLGLHSVYNAMAAILVALLYGIPVAVIQKALKKFRGVERRFELIFEEDFLVLDDHFANSLNIHVTLETLQMMDYKALHLVYAIRGGRGVTVNRENAEALAHWAPLLGLNKVIATMSTSHVEEKDIVTAEEQKVFETVMEEAGIKTETYKELPEAINHGLEEVKPGDVLLLAGCQGMDYGAAICLEQIHRLKPHLDKDKVFAALKNRVAGV